MHDNFAEEAKEGARTVAGIMSVLISLMVAAGVLWASGFLDAPAASLGQWAGHIGLPAGLVPVTLVKTFFSSAAMGLALDIFKRFGTDSYCGLITSIMLNCTETIFHTMSVRFMTAQVRKTRYMLAGVLITTLSGAIVSVVLVDITVGK